MARDRGKLLFSNDPASGGETRLLGEFDRDRHVHDDKTEKKHQIGGGGNSVETPRAKSGEIAQEDLTDDLIYSAVDAAIDTGPEKENRAEKTQRLKVLADAYEITLKRFSKAGLRKAMAEKIRKGEVQLYWPELPPVPQTVVESKTEVVEPAEARNYDHIRNILRNDRLEGQSIGTVSNSVRNDPELPDDLFVEGYERLLAKWRVGDRQRGNIARLEASIAGKRYRQLKEKKSDQPIGFGSAAKNIEREVAALARLRERFTNAREKQDSGEGLAALADAEQLLNTALAQPENQARRRLLEHKLQMVKADRNRIQAVLNKPAEPVEPPAPTAQALQSNELSKMTIPELREAFKDAREKRDADKGLSALVEAEHRYDRLIAKESDAVEKKRLEAGKAEIIADRQAIYDAVSRGRLKDKIARQADPAVEIQRKEKQVKLTRDAADITRARIAPYTDLHPFHAETEELGDVKFKQISRELWKEFALHGIARKKAGSDEYSLMKRADLDGRIALKLLEEAGFDISGTEYIPQGESLAGKINIDTGGKEGLVVEDEGATAYFDHHAPESRGNNSATKIMYEVLTRLGFLEKKEGYDKVVDFVNKSDNMLFPRNAYGLKSARTMVGLRRQLTFRQMFSLLGKYGPTDPIPEDQLKRMEMPRQGKARRDKSIVAETLWDVSERRREQVEADHKRFAKMEGEGLVIDSPEYGKVVVDIHGTLITGADAAKAHGAGMFIKWMPETKSFFVSTFGVDLNKKHKLGQGKAIRNTMWIKAHHDDSPLTTKLEDVLTVVTDDSFEPKDRLKQYLDSPESFPAAVWKKSPDAADSSPSPEPRKKSKEFSRGELLGIFEQINRTIDQAKIGLVSDTITSSAELQAKIEPIIQKVDPQNPAKTVTTELEPIMREAAVELQRNLETYERAYERESKLRTAAQESWDETIAEKINEHLARGYTDQEISNYMQSQQYADFLREKPQIIKDTLVELRTL